MGQIFMMCSGWKRLGWEPVLPSTHSPGPGLWPLQWGIWGGGGKDPGSLRPLNPEPTPKAPSMYGRGRTGKGRSFRDGEAK